MWNVGRPPTWHHKNLLVSWMAASWLASSPDSWANVAVRLWVQATGPNWAWITKLFCTEEMFQLVLFFICSIAFISRQIKTQHVHVIYCLSPFTAFVSETWEHCQCVLLLHCFLLSLLKFLEHNVIVMGLARHLIPGRYNKKVVRRNYYTSYNTSQNWLHPSHFCKYSQHDRN